MKKKVINIAIRPDEAITLNITMAAPAVKSKLGVTPTPPKKKAPIAALKPKTTKKTVSKKTKK